jgi:SNF2 family DNA or RNA helicase
MGLHSNHPKVKNAIASNKSAEALTLLTEFRRKIGLLKVRGIVEHVKELVAKGEKVVIFAHHREVVDAYAEAFSGIKIQGGMGTKKIEQVKHLFNSTSVEEHPVLPVSIEAGKTGHTLCMQYKYGIQNCAIIIFAEEPYVYGDSEQCEDRVYRIGQDRNVYIWNMMVRNTVDERIYEIREEKRKVFNALVDGVSLESDNNESVAKQILKLYM